MTLISAERLPLPASPISYHISDVSELARSLEPLGLEPLREAWRARYGPPPRLRSVELLRRLLAWRIQSEALGGLDPDTTKMVRTKAAMGGAALAPGSKAAREWKGVRFEVEIVEGGGVMYAGERYESLSAVAREITGVRWNGPRFFGLRPSGKGAA